MTTKPEAAIYDVDGTLADTTSILHLIDRLHPLFVAETFDPDVYHAASIDIPVNAEVLDMLNEDYDNGLYIVVLTARREKYRQVTELWMAMNEVRSHRFVMRANDDDRPDHEFKIDLLQDLRRTHTVVRAVDDKPSVIDTWVRLGIPDVVDVETWPTYEERLTV